MATTSGLANTVTITRDEMITSAMQELRVISATGSPTADDLISCARRLNMLLKRWETKGLLLWLYDTIQVPQVQNQIVYDLGPPSGDFPDYRPLRVLEGSFIRQTCGATPNDIQLIIWSRVVYDQTSYKPALGVTNSIYYDVQMRPGIQVYDPSQGRGKLYCYPAPQDSTRTLFLNVQRPIQDVTAGDQTFDLPLEWMEPLMIGLAAACANVYEIPLDRTQMLKQEAAALLEEIADWGVQEWAPMTFRPDFQQGMQR